MLSEKKKRQRISVDPQNKAWQAGSQISLPVVDTASYGHKLLERMGWKKGAGLGKDSDGTTTHPSVEIKNDNKGVGSSIEESTGASATCIGTFDTLLKSINGSGGFSEKQKKPKKAKKLHEHEMARLSHRARYIKSKSVSAYSDRCLAEILGFGKQLQPKMD